MLPPTPEAYWAHLDDMIDNTLVEHPVAHEVIAGLDRAPSPPWLPGFLGLAWPPARLAAAPMWRLLNVGLLPSAGRDKLRAALDGG